MLFFLGSIILMMMTLFFTPITTPNDTLPPKAYHTAKQLLFNTILYDG
jgi:hypothetical protein